jgi:LysR family hydrogen peroxide-inducible transcriptional activator
MSEDDTVTLQELRYFVAVAESRHFVRAAAVCHVSQPTLSGQLRKLEDELGITLLERTNKQVELTSVGRDILIHAQRILAESAQIESMAKAARDPMVGVLRLGAIPTLAPYLIPLVLAPLRRSYPQLTVELWEDQTHSLIEALGAHRLDAALVASHVGTPEIVEVALFAEPLLAVLPLNHALAVHKSADESKLACDLLVMADGHCLSNHALAACGAKAGLQSTMRAATLDTLVNLVAAGYGTTLIPALAAPTLKRRGVKVIPLRRLMTRTISLVSRSTFPRTLALKAVEREVRDAVPPSWVCSTDC